MRETGLGVLWVVLALAPAVQADQELDYGLEQTRLARLEISGNETFSDKEVTSVLRFQVRDWRRPLGTPSYRPDLIDTQLRLLRSWYHQRGFHQVAVELDSTGVDADLGDILYISVEEGPRIYIERVVFQGAEPLTEQDLRKVLTLVEGQPAPANINGFGEDIYQMRRLYWGLAHLRVRIDADLQLAEESAVIAYTVQPGPAYTVRDVTISGYETTRPELITRELRLEVGDLFAWDKVDLTRYHLLQTSLFRDVSLTVADWDTASHSAVLRVHVTERKPAYYELGIGFGSRERIRAQAAWGHNNLWGTGQRFSARLRVNWNVEEILGHRRDFSQGELNYRADLIYNYPHPLGRDYPLDVNLFTKRETRGESALIQETTGFLVGTSRQDNLRWTSRLDFRLKVVDPEVHPLAPDDLKERFEEANVEATQTRSFIFSLLYEGRDNLFNPRAGRHFTSQLELAGGLLGGDNSFLKWSGVVHRYWDWLGGVLAARVRLGAVRPYADSRDLGSDGVPYDDRFFAGGTYSVRGYLDNSLGPQILDPSEQELIDWGSDVPLADNPARGGNYQFITNLEWRFPMPVLSRWSFASVFFFDGGNVWEELSDILLKGFRLRSYPGEPTDPTSTKIWDYRYSVGTGIRLDTPVGPVRLDIGFPLKRARYVNLETTVVDDKWRIHFSLGHIF